jgi:hypothetical protein
MALTPILNQPVRFSPELSTSTSNSKIEKSHHLGAKSVLRFTVTLTSIC